MKPGFFGIFLFLICAFRATAQDDSTQIQNGISDTAKTGSSVRTQPIVGTLDLFLPAPVVSGQGRDEFDIARRILNKKNYFLQCYTGNLSKFDPLTFRIRFEIIVLPSGEVQSVNTLMKGTKNQVMINCIRSVFRQIRFGPSEKTGTMIIEQSLIFRVI